MIKRSFNILILFIIVFYPLLNLFARQSSASKQTFEVSFPESVSSEPLTGRMFLAFAHNDQIEPRLQVRRYGVQFFGIDFVNLKPGEAILFDAEILGYPAASLTELPEEEFFVQAVLNKYTEFKRSDGHTIWMNNDQWEGQNWRRSPGNVYSNVQKLRLNHSKKKTIQFIVDKIIPPIKVAADTDWIKRVKIKSEQLTEFWGQPIYIGATVLLPRGYKEHPNVNYPTIYHQGHFSLRPPLRFNRDSTFTADWKSENFPRFIAVTIQHPTPYFDDSYAVNSVNNGPYGDAIHQKLIPLLEEKFRMISESYGRVLTGGSTGGWEAFALQVFYSDFYGGSWAFAPDPLDFRNVEGINIYKDKNAFYKEHDWYKVPIANTRDHRNGEVRLTSKQRNTMELVNGTIGRSGQQLDIWSAVFGPVGKNGYFKPLFNKSTGEIDSSVAEYWKENYDLRYYLEKNWQQIGHNLVGKLNVICGHMDNYYLNIGVYHMEDFLESTRNPYYAGSFTYGARGGHGWRPYSTTTLLRLMADHITKNAPPGTKTQSWKY